MKSKLLIIGASGHGKVVADVAMKMNRWESINFIDDDESIKEIMGIKVIDSTDSIVQYIDEYDIFVAIGNNQTRRKIQEKIKVLGASIPTLIHPSSILGIDVNIEEGTVIMAGVIINSSTSIGRGCIINTGATIDHDNIINDYVHISPGVNIAGTVEVGKETWVGIGARVSNNINITSNCIIGAGGVVIEDIDKSGIYVGIPIRKLNYT